MSVKKFLKETEPAVQHMFAALDHYNGLKPFRKEYYKKNGCAQARKEVIKFLGRNINSMGLDMAKVTLCGAIVQVAYSAIKQYSKNGAIPISCGRLDIPIDNEKAGFYIGREVHGIPMGLLIFAAREQYSNWELGTPSNPIAKGIFEHLRSLRNRDIWQDLLYELDWPVKRPAAHYIIQKELKWLSYDDYISDMSQALSM